MIREILRVGIFEALTTLEVEPLPERDRVALERPGRREHGDWSSNVAMVSGKRAGWVPRELAGKIAEILNADPPHHVDRVEIAGPGFVNFFLADAWLLEIMGSVIEEGAARYASPQVGEGKRVNIEFVSANPTGPLHAGHGRGAAYGDSLARIMGRCGYAVERESYLNDRGVQMQNFAASLLARREGELPPEGGYHGKYLTEWAAEMPQDADALEWGYARSLEEHRQTVARMHVHFDTWFSEREMVGTGAVEKTLADLGERGMVYEADGATWLRSSNYGDEKDRVLIKSDGDYTYITPDIAYHRDKFARGFDLLVDVWGADHHGYVPRMKAAVEALGHDPNELECQITQLVNLMDGGKPVKLSKRTGDIIELSEVLDEVGADAARLTYLLQSIDSALNFDFAEVKAQGMENPVYYVQMAYARIRSIQRKAEEAGVDRIPFAEVDRSLLSSSREHDVLRCLSELPETVEAACRDRAPHKVTTWVRDLAGAFHGFYHDCYVLSDENSEELTQARLWLVEAGSIGLEIGLGLLGISAPERM